MGTAYAGARGHRERRDRAPCAAPRHTVNPKVRTLANNKGHIEIHGKPALGSTPLAELRPTQLREFVIALRSKSVGRGEQRFGGDGGCCMCSTGAQQVRGGGGIAR